MDHGPKVKSCQLSAAKKKAKRQRAKERAKEKKREEQLAKEEKERAICLQSKKDYRCEMQCLWKGCIAIWIQEVRYEILLNQMCKEWSFMKM
jgi:hypothetical protein